MKISITLVLLLSVLFCKAQQFNIYYIGKTGTPVNNIDSANLIRTVAVDKSASDAYQFVEYFLDKTVKKRGYSLTNNYRLKYTGNIITYYKAGNKASLEAYKNGELNGISTYFFENDSVKKRVSYAYNEKGEKLETFIELNDSLGNHYLNNTGTGIYKATNSDGELIEEEYLNGKRNGTWKIFVPTIKETYIAEFKEGEFVKGRIINARGKSKTITQAETLPSFPGGQYAFNIYLQRNLKYPKMAQSNSTQGKVLVRFVIQKDGSIAEAQVMRGIGDGCDEEALRVIRNSPYWNPGTQNGLPIKVIYTIPINFELLTNMTPTTIRQNQF